MSKNLINSNDINIIPTSENISLEITDNKIQEIQNEPIVDIYTSDNTEKIYSVNYINNFRKLIWYNLNPTTNFSAQTITLNEELEIGDIIEVFYYQAVSSFRMKSISFIYNDTTLGTVINWFDTARGSTWYRNIDIVDNTHLSFTTGYNNYSSGTTSNVDLIPIYIIKYKTNLITTGGGN